MRSPFAPGAIVAIVAIVALALSAIVAAQAGRGGAPAAPAVPAAEVSSAIDKLGSFEFPVRAAASRTVRRAPADVAVPALARAARQHADGYIRYRALVLLAGFGDAPAAQVMREVMPDRNDRLRAVAYAWFEQHREVSVIPMLIEASHLEQSDVVRPALLRALAAHSDDPRARAAALPLVMRGQDDFRGAMIDALGDYRATYAVASIAEVAKLEGPLQDDAVMALGKIGDKSAHDVLADLQRNSPRVVQPSISAALWLLGSNVAANDDFLKKSLTFAASTGGNQPLLRGAAHALAVLAVRDHPSALTALLDAGVPSADPARAPIALGVGRVALRNPALLLNVLEPRADRDGVILLLQDAFDMLSSEDYQLERFYVEIRRAYWSAAPDSPRRRLAEALITKLEF